MKTTILPLLVAALVLAGGTAPRAVGAPAAPQGVIAARIYTGIGGVVISALTNSAKFPNSPDLLRHEPYFELWAGGDIATAAAADVMNDYGAQMIGYFYPETTGAYTFWLSADDMAELYLSIDDSPANKRRIAIEPQWNNPRDFAAATRRDPAAPENSSATYAATQWPSGNTITLTNGRAYYIEALVKEGGGGDNLSVSIDGLTPIPGSRLASFVTDTTAPTVVSAVGSAVFTQVTVNFSEQVDRATATTLANYSISGGLTVSAATLGATGTNVVLTTSRQTTNTVYTVTVRNVKDALGNVMTPSPTTVDFRGFVLARGAVTHKFWANNTANNIATLTSDPRFPDSPTFVTSEPAFEYPPNGGNEAGANYGNQLVGFLHPPVTGNYVFYVSGDDPVELYLSTDETVGNRALIAQEPAWNNAREWQTPGSNAGGRDLTNPENKSAPIALIAGRTYYIEALHTEGGGGDSMGATWQLPGAQPPASGTPPIQGEFLSTFAFPATDADLQITLQPQNTSAEQNRSATFTAAATTTVPGGTPRFQWQRAPSGSSTFTNIPNATGASFTTARLALTDTSAKYRVLVSVPGLTKQSAEATLTVVPDTTPPQAFQVTSINAFATEITMSFNELMDKASTELAAGYVFSPGNIVATNVVLDATGTNVVIKTGGQLTATVTNTLTLTGVKDLAGNAAGPNTKIDFAFSRVTYAANIQFDGPLGYYRFEETSGNVAVNSGTTGGDGAYYQGDEAAPGAGGNPATPKGDPGPRPPLFAGFDAANRAATFTGFAANGGTEEWVDTRNKWLQNLAAFSLEYWVLTTDRANQGNRIAIVGQNDSVEYGFILPDTIEMWTDGGGAIRTPYTFPDNEWHHVATIADGTAIRNYYDGVLVGSGGTPTANYGANDIYNVKIGGGGVNDATGGFFTGRIDEVAIFNKAIPAPRVLAHYLAGKEGGTLITYSRSHAPPAGITLSVTRSGANLTIRWSPEGGTLESTGALTGSAATTVWTAVGAANPATVPIGTASRFYRVRVP